MTMMITMTSNNSIGRLALESMLIEVSVTPKPGLVDRNNSGAHRDMGFFTFMRSAAGLHSCFDEFAESGFIAGINKLSPSKVFANIRKIGIMAEEKMFAATGGINTHKGEIFSLGLLSASAGYLAGSKGVMNSDSVMNLAGKICAGICEHDFGEARNKDYDSLSNGERIYLAHGITGIRGEAESGYQTVRNISLPALKKYLSRGLSMNDSLAFTLINIMAAAQDTNIISRHNIETAGEVMNLSRKMLEREDLTLQEIHKLDEEFIRRNISPGGSGDLLAVTYFLYMLDIIT